MKITRQNYEHWFIDFIEGNLELRDEVLVRKFVKLNPDLNSELEDLMDFKLIPEQTKFGDKDLLKQNSFKAITGITKFERLSIAYLENELNSNEQKELNRLLINSDKKKKEFQLIQKTKLTADNNIEYSQKNSLKKLIIIKNKTQNFKLIYRIAAVFVLLIGLTFLLNQKNKTKLTGKQLTKVQAIQQNKRMVNSKKTDVFYFNNDIAIVLPEKNKTKINEIRQTVIVPKELTAHKCNSINNDNITPGSDSFAERIYNSTYAINNNIENERPGINKKIMYTIKLAGKSAVSGVSKFFKTNFKYEKKHTEDGRTLIALKAGDFEYIASKKQKK